MKIKGIVLATTLLVANLAHAHIIVFTSSGAPMDVCSALTGAWNGNGTVKIEKSMCNYAGTAQITPTSDTAFSTALNLTKKSGSGPLSPLCINLSETLKGMCDNGSINIDDQGVNLTGTLSSDGRSATLAGTVTADGMTVDVENLVLNKQ